MLRDRASEDFLGGRILEAIPVVQRLRRRAGIGNSRWWQIGVKVTPNAALHYVSSAGTASFRKAAVRQRSSATAALFIWGGGPRELGRYGT